MDANMKSLDNLTDLLNNQMDAAEATKEAQIERIEEGISLEMQTIALLGRDLPELAADYIENPEPLKLRVQEGLEANATIHTLKRAVSLTESREPNFDELTNALTALDLNATVYEEAPTKGGLEQLTTLCEELQESAQKSQMVLDIDGFLEEARGMLQ